TGSDEDVAACVDGNAVDRFESRLQGLALVAREPGLAGAGDCLDNPPAVDPSHSSVVTDVEIPGAVDRHRQTADLCLRRRAAVAREAFFSGADGRRQFAVSTEFGDAVPVEDVEVASSVERQVRRDGEVD